MAVAVEAKNAVANSQPTGVTPNKKPRKNPARRKAERTNTSTSTEPPKGPIPSSRSITVVRENMPRQLSAPSVLGDTAPQRPATDSKRSTTTVSPPTVDPTSTIVATRKHSINSTLNQEKQQKSITSTTPNTSTRPSFRRSQTSASSLAFNAPALITGGLIGCAAGAAILMAVHVWYDFAGVKAAIATARAARLCVDNLSEELITSLSMGTYSTDEALDILRRTTLAYAGLIPGGGPVVERIFREIALVRQSRGVEVDKVLACAFDELRAAGDKGLSAVETRDVVLKHLVKLSAFASRATQDVLKRNPRLKPLRDGAVKALKEPPKEKVPTTKVNLVVKHR